MRRSARSLSTFAASVALLAVCQPSPPADDNPYGILPIGDVDTAPPIMRRYVGLLRTFVTDSEPAVMHQAALCEPDRVAREVGLHRSDTLAQWVLRSVYTTREDTVKVNAALAQLHGSFTASGGLCEDLADLVASETEDGVVPLTVSEAQRELIRRNRRANGGR
jgi:hypothetical protein